MKQNRLETFELSQFQIMKKQFQTFFDTLKSIIYLFSQESSCAIGKPRGRLE